MKTLLNREQPEFVQILPFSGIVLLEDMYRFKVENTPVLMERSVQNRILPVRKRELPPAAVNNRKLYSVGDRYGVQHTEYARGDLEDIGKTMIAMEGDFSEDVMSMKNNYYPALLTFLLQFLDHDLTFLELDNFEDRLDVIQLENIRSALLDLDSVFDGDAVYENGKLLLRENENGVLDVPRRNGIQILGDIRNGENQLILQTHMLFMKYYNKVFDEMTGSIEERMASARKLTCWVWQWMLVRELMPMICGKYYNGLFDGNGEPKFSVIKPELGALPWEFAFSVFRLHSIIREKYYTNSAKSFPIVSRYGENLAGFRPLQKRDEMKMDYFWPMDNFMGFQQCHSLSNILAYNLGNLPNEIVHDGVVNLAQRSLLRNNQTLIGSAQDYCDKLGVNGLNEVKLYDVNFTRNGSVVGERMRALEGRMNERCPLFYYILKEAGVYGNGISYGPLGALLFGETILAQLFADRNSFVYEEWQPIEGVGGCKRDGEFCVEDFLDYVGENNGTGVVYFKPDLYTNLMDVGNNKVNLDKLRENEMEFKCKVVVNKEEELKVGEKLIIMNNVKYGLARINLKVMNYDETRIMQELVFYGEGDVIELQWNGSEYVI